MATVEELDPNRLREVGAWSEQFSSSGKRYFYNRETEVSQWAKPQEWTEAEEKHALEKAERLRAEQARITAILQQERLLLQQQQQQQQQEQTQQEQKQQEEDERAQSEQRESQSASAMDVVAEEEEEEPEWKRLYRPDLAAALSKKIFGEEEAENEPDLFRQMVLSAVEHHVIATEKLTEVHKAHSLARTSFMRARILQQKASMLREAQDDLEKARIDFQTNFATAMPKLLENASGRPVPVLSIGENHSTEQNAASTSTPTST